MIEGISAVTLGTHEMPRAVRFYRALGFEVLHGGEESSFTSFRAGTSYLNLTAQPAERRWSWWGRVIFFVADVDALYDRALAAGYQPATVPHDAEWGERFFHLIDPDGHELSFARPLLPVSVHKQLEAACHSKRRWERVWCSDYPLNLGGNHAVQDNRTTVARRDGASRLRDRTNNPRSAGNYTNSGRRNQTADRDGRAAEHHTSAGREERRLDGQRHPLPDVRIERGRTRGRDKNAQRRGGAVTRRGKTRGAS